MPKNLFQYGLNEWGQKDGVPSGFTADGRMEPDADALWRADAGDIKSKYDIVSASTPATTKPASGRNSAR